MITREEIVEILKGVTHPETGKNLIEDGIAQSVDFTDEGKIVLTLSFRRKRDPFARSVATRAKLAIEAAAEGADVEVPVGSNSKNAMVPMTTINTTNILFICGGAFPDLEEIIRKRMQALPYRS